MRTVLLLSVILALSIALAGQAPVHRADHAKDEAQDLCSISGRVVSAAEGTPLKSARVALIQQNAGRDRKLYGATTDSSGRFVLKDVMAGRYRFAASRTGYVSQEYQSQGAICYRCGTRTQEHRPEASGA